MNTIDIIIILCFIPFLINGITKGFIAQITDLISIILGVWIAFRFSNLLCTFIGKYIDSSLIILYINSLVLIMITVTVGLKAIGQFLTSVVKIIMLGWLNTILGIIFSGIKALVLLCFMIIIFNSVNINFHIVDNEVLNNSVLYQPLNRIAITIFPYFKKFLTI